MAGTLPSSSARPWPALASSNGLLGLCPLLAAGAGILSALTISAVFVAVLCASVLSASLCRRLLSGDNELACLLIMTATWVTAAGLLLQSAAYPVHAALGIYVPVMAGNWLLLAQLEERALTSSTPVSALSDAFRTGFQVAAMVICAGLLREFFSAGGWFSDGGLPGWHGRIAILPFTLPVMGSAAGAFFALSILAAAFNRVRPDRASG